MQHFVVNAPTDTTHKAFATDLRAVFRKHGIDTSNIDITVDGKSVLEEEAAPTSTATNRGHDVTAAYSLPDEFDHLTPRPLPARAGGNATDHYSLPEA